jgi:hypothetical protein
MNMQAPVGVKKDKKQGSAAFLGWLHEKPFLCLFFFSILQRVVTIPMFSHPVIGSFSPSALERLP